MRTITQTTILTTLLMMPTTLLAQQWGRGDYGPHMMWGDGMYFGPIMTLVFIAVIVFIVMSLVRWLSANKPESSQSSALDILRERFAKGEIDKEEYEERRKILGNDP